MNYAIDLDGVVVDWDGGFRKVWNDTHPDHQIQPHSHTWESPFIDTGLSHAEFWQWIDDNEVYRDLPPLMGAVYAVKLIAAKHTVHYVTARHEVATEITEEWLRRYDIWHPTWHKQDKKDHVADVYVDDNCENLSAYVAHHPDKQVFRVVQPWNHHIEGTIPIFHLIEIA